MSVLRATDFEIVRNVPVSGKEKTALARCPIRVVTILNEKMLTDSGFLLLHNQTVFFEDKVHDWNWDDGALRYYTRATDGHADVLAIYAEDRINPTQEQMAAAIGTVPKFDSMTGERL